MRREFKSVEHSFRHAPQSIRCLYCGMDEYAHIPVRKPVPWLKIGLFVVGVLLISFAIGSF